MHTEFKVKSRRKNYLFMPARLFVEVITYNDGTTSDAYLVAGDRLSFTCQLSADSSVTCSTPYFVTSSGRRPVEQRRVSASAVELVVEHVSDVDNGSYYCYSDDPSRTDGITINVKS